MTLNAEQPAPKATDRRPAWELVIEFVQAKWPGADTEDETMKAFIVDMRERDRIGRERYGVPLTADNGRDHLVDAFQECLDLMVYLRAWLDERGRDPAREPIGEMPIVVDHKRDLLAEHVIMQIFDHAVDAGLALKELLR